MDTEEQFRDDEFFVAMAGERGPAWYVERMESAESAVSISPASDESLWGAPVDGWVTFYSPTLLDAGEPFKHLTIPFRSVEREGEWLGNPDGLDGTRRPIWKWENPDADPHEALTLSPSIGMGAPDPHFHCHIREGAIQWQ